MSNTTQLWYELMTSTELPLLSSSLIVERCTWSSSSFDVVNKDSFDSYRTTSTSLHQGLCVGLPQGVVNGQVHMLIQARNIPALFLLYGQNPFVNFEYEIVLTPGLRFTWIKKAPEVTGLEREIALSEEIGGEWTRSETQITKGLGGDWLRYYRMYEAQFIPIPEEKKFINPTIARRSRDLRELSAKLDVIILRHRAQKRIQELAFKTRKRIQEQIKNKKEAEDKCQEQALKAYNKLSATIKDALQSEKTFGKHPTPEQVKEIQKKFITAELVYQISLGLRIPSLDLNVNSDLLHEFQKSRRGQKYAVGLSNHPSYCHALRQASELGLYKELR